MRPNDDQQKIRKQPIRRLCQAKRLMLLILFNRTTTQQLFHVPIDGWQRNLTSPDQLFS